MNTFSRHRIKVKLDPSAVEVNTNLFTHSVPLMYKGRSAQVEMCLFFGDELQDISNIVTLTAVVKAVTAGIVDVAGSNIFSKTIGTSDFDTTVQEADWNNSTKQHFLLPLEYDETGWTLTDAESPNVKDFQMIVTATTNDATTRVVTLANFLIRMQDDGGRTSVNTPAKGDPLYYTADEVQAIANGMVSRVMPAGGWLQLTNNLGYGIRIQATPDSTQPELEVIQLSPPA